MSEIDFEKCELFPKGWSRHVKIVYKDKPKSSFYLGVEEDALKVLKYLLFKEWSNQSPPVRTSPNGDFYKEKEHNISLKDNSLELSQMSNDTSVNSDIHRNCGFALQSRVNPHTQLNPSLNEVKRNC